MFKFSIVQCIKYSFKNYYRSNKCAFLKIQDANIDFQKMVKTHLEQNLLILVNIIMKRFYSHPEQITLIPCILHQGKFSDSAHDSR